MSTVEDSCIYAISPYIDTRSHSRPPWALDRRGWVLQERMLPARTIKFGSYLSWECRESTRDEFDLEEAEDFEKLVSNFFSKVVEANGPVDEEEAESIYSMWMDTVTVFCNTRLTFPSDRYAAVMGLIQAIKRRTGWVEVAGLWGPFLVHGPLWSPEIGFTTSRQPRRTGLSPTWSWISVDCERTYPSKGKGDEELASVDIEALSAITRDVSGASSITLELSAFLIPVQKIRPSRYWYHHMRLEGWTRDDQAWAQFDIDVPSPADSLAFLPILISDRSIRGLVINPSATSDGCFERVGHPWVYLQAPKRQKAQLSAGHDSDSSSGADLDSDDNSDFVQEDQEGISLRAERRDRLEGCGRRCVTLV